MPEPKIAQKKPYVIDMKKGTYVYCRCGLSQKQPFCDNSHKGTEYQGTDCAAMAVVIDEDGPKPWCGCKHSKTLPWCDGEHTKLK